MLGARQTGKTYLLRAFGRERYAASHYFNFEQTPDLASLFRRDLDPQRIVRYADRRSFRVYALDVSLLGALAGAPPRLLVHGDRLFEEYRGALVENYVAQQLTAAAAGELHYWRSSGGKAEVDFLREREGEVFPLEVKAGVNPRSKSLRSFDSQFAPPLLVRSTLVNLKRDARVLNIPLYALPDGLRFISNRE